MSGIDTSQNEINLAASRTAFAVEASKAKCRTLIAELETYRPGRVLALHMWIDGAWGDYWYVTLDGQDVGEIWYDSFGPVVKGDALSTLAYRASRAAEIRMSCGEGEI